MGVITLDQLRDELAFAFSNRADTGFSDTRLNRWINAAYLHLCHPSVHQHREMQTSYTITLVSGTNEYSLTPATVGFTIVAIRRAYHIMATSATPTARKRKLDPKSAHWFDRTTLPTGQPTTYGVDGQTLFLSGVPGTAESGQLVRLRVWREPALLSADADVTVLPTYWDKVLQLGAQWLAEVDLGYRDRAELTKGDYMALINEVGERRQLEAEDTGWEVELESANERGMY